MLVLNGANLGETDIEAACAEGMGKCYGTNIDFTCTTNACKPINAEAKATYVTLQKRLNRYADALSFSKIRTDGVLDVATLACAMQVTAFLREGMYKANKMPIPPLSRVPYYHPTLGLPTFAVVAPVLLLQMDIAESIVKVDFKTTTTTDTKKMSIWPFVAVGTGIVGLVAAVMVWRK